MEEHYIRAIKGAILKVKNPNTSDDDRRDAMASAGRNLGKLKVVNEGFYEDLYTLYLNALPED